LCDWRDAGNFGPHGYSEVLYNFTTAAANNGSAFAGLNGNTPWYNLAIGFVILRLAKKVSALGRANSHRSGKDSPKRVQALMGHSTIQMTFDIYGHLFPSKDSDAAAMGWTGFPS
jgi:K+-transporting ATPase A subunit